MRNNIISTIANVTRFVVLGAGMLRAGNDPAAADRHLEQCTAGNLSSWYSRTILLFWNVTDTVKPGEIKASKSGPYNQPFTQPQVLSHFAFQRTS